ncbi:DUF1015 family protein [Protofrankia symbiont of Coriaria ruscifolia]|uniref:DUF1015 domain-containing protein n=1 Tax=Candidatus Protofrankia californiensis TaxID=1839754 RepID=A0A1C3P950_9ACTN|nr:DUF1015 domain-containing protein [Protofrankia symbiont of Coriaria ruscifolia]SBW26326.1 hypothetical protein FDG2_4855 [Candidatus Protofrankia californiensis]
MAAPVPAPPTPGGLVLAPFRALRYAVDDGRELASRTAPPYDVIDAAGVIALEARHPHNVVRLILPRDSDEQSPGSRYRRAADALREWTAGAVLRRDDRPALYVYEQTHDGHVQRGLVGAVALADPDAGIILPHENTMTGPVTDRLALTVTTGANLEPIFLLYEGGGAASQIASDTVATSPILTTTTDDGVTHRIWALTDQDRLAAVADDLYGRRAVIADGHHRYATYRRYQADRHAAGDGAGPWDFGLAFLVDARVSGPQVHAIHRVVRGLALAEAVRRAGAAFQVTPLDTVGDPSGVHLLGELAKAGQDGHAFVITDGRAAFLLTHPDPALLTDALPADRSTAFRQLDVTVAHLVLITKVWGLPDTEDVVGYRHDAAAAIAAAASPPGAGTATTPPGGTTATSLSDAGSTAPGGAIALLLNPTPAADVAAVAAAGERMPRKSTLFTPKPRSGLLIRPLDG